MKPPSIAVFILSLILAQEIPAAGEQGGFIFADPEIFRIEKIGSDALATNIYSLALDALDEKTKLFGRMGGVGHQWGNS